MGELIMDVSKMRERIEGLQAGLRDTEKQIELLQATRIATDGALQESRYWLGILLADKVKTTEEVKN